MLRESSISCCRSEKMVAALRKSQRDNRDMTYSQDKCRKGGRELGRLAAVKDGSTAGRNDAIFYREKTLFNKVRGTDNDKKRVWKGKTKAPEKASFAASRIRRI